jgi:hypothetical protein
MKTIALLSILLLLSCQQEPTVHHIYDPGPYVQVRERVDTTSREWNSDLTLQGDWYLGIVTSWETRIFGFEMVNGVSDLIFNNASMIKETGDESEWAVDCLERCFLLLDQRKRWPDSIDAWIPDDRQCRTRVGTFINKQGWRIARRLGRDGMRKFRSQGDMTRDPYIASIACAVEMDRMDLVMEVELPWYLWRPTTSRWLRYLREPTRKHWDSWLRAERISERFNDKEFVDRLKQHRREAAEYICGCIIN